MIFEPAQRVGEICNSLLFNWKVVAQNCPLTFPLESTNYTEDIRARSDLKKTIVFFYHLGTWSKYLFEVSKTCQWLSGILI